MNRFLEEIVQFGLYGIKRTLFMTPLMLVSERISGIETGQSLNARLLSIGVNFFIAMPYNNLFKPMVERMLGIDDNSSRYSRENANRIAFAAHQIPVYAGLLVVSGASLEQIATAVPIGVAVGLGTSGMFQDFMDKDPNHKNRNNLENALLLGKNYAKNLGYATLIALSIRTGIAKGIQYVGSHNIFSSDTVLVVDSRTEGFYFSDKDKYDARYHMMIEF